VLLRDAHVLALDKPAGLLSVPGRGGAVVGEALSVLARGLDPSALPVHRLDRGTSGVLVLALGREAHRALSQAFEGRRTEKRYLALVRGDLAAAAECDLPLLPTRRGGMRVAAADEQGAQPSRTSFTPLERFGAFTLVEARPQTGRTHQIRVHLAALRHPLLVDERYGDPRPLVAEDLCHGAGQGVVLARTALHAAGLRLPRPLGKGWLAVEAPLPPDLSACLELLRAARRAG
jgi:tRNA pseudouridine32 synthase/23S rRNA pseudouridine746 synthase